MLLAVTPPQKGLVCFLVHWQSVRLAQTTALHWSSTTVAVVNNVHHGNSDLVAMKGFVTNKMIRTESQRCEGTKTETAREVPTTKITPRQKPHTHTSKTLKEISQPPTPTRSATRQQPERPLPLEQHMNHLKSMFRGRTCHTTSSGGSQCRGLCHGSQGVPPLRVVHELSYTPGMSLSPQLLGKSDRDVHGAHTLCGQEARTRLSSKRRYKCVRTYEYFFGKTCSTNSSP